MSFVEMRRKPPGRCRRPLEIHQFPNVMFNHRFASTHSRFSTPRQLTRRVFLPLKFCLMRICYQLRFQSVGPFGYDYLTELFFS